MSPRVAAAGLTAALALASGAGAQGGDTRPLESEQPFEGSIDVRGPGSVCFELDLPDDIVALDLELACTLADLDLHANPGEHVGEDGRSLWSAASEEGDERLTIHRLGDAALQGGRVFVCVLYEFDSAPIVDGRELERAAFRLTARVFRARIDAELVPGTAHRDVLEPNSGGLRTYVVDVPEGAPALRLDLFDVSGDVDLFAGHGVRLLAPGAQTAAAMNPWGAEILVLTPRSVPPLVPGRWLVQVENLVEPGERAAFALVASLDPEPPELVCGLPPSLGAPADARGLARALPGVFELFCGPFAGSGTCIAREGWILTNAHVVALGPGAEVVVCVPLERGLPARESFRGRVEAFDAGRDLALVRVVSGFRGESIPAGYAFPAVPLGEPSALEMGEPLTLVGYPTAGGQRSRVTISVSRGIVSGFERSEHGLLIKTDAEIQGGSSGGAALDAEGLLVGVPTSLVESGAGQFGYIQPLDALPAAWRERLGLAR